jgi:hypothetical protein
MTVAVKPVRAAQELARTDDAKLLVASARAASTGLDRFSKRARVAGVSVGVVKHGPGAAQGTWESRPTNWARLRG